MKKIIWFIFLFALFLRVYRIGDFPALNADEAAIGYNSYSIIRTAHDEHGNYLPIHFQSFNDYKPGLIFYLVAPAIYLWGLKVWAIRIIPVIISSLTIPALYYLVKELKFHPNENMKEKVALVSAALLAISPWHIHFSRGAWEVSVATFLVVAAVYFFLAKDKHKYNLVTSVLLVSLALYTYHSARVFGPLLFAWLMFSNSKTILKDLRKYSVAFIFGVLLILPLIYDFAGPAGLSRASGVGLFADPGPLSRVNEQRGEHGNFAGIVPKLFHNKAVNYGLAFAKNWTSHYHGEFLFLSGDEIQRNKVPETGQLYIFEVVFLVAGLFAIAQKPKGWGLVLWWLAIAPITSALTFQSPHGLRAHNMVIPLMIIIAFGIISSVEFVRKQPKKLLPAFYGLIAMLYIWGFARYEHMYWVHMAKEYPYSSQYGVQKLVDFIASRDGAYDKVIITDRYDQPYILFLFYLQYPPEKFQKEHQLTPPDEYGFSTVRSFANYEFRSIKFDEDRPNNPNSLIAGTDEEVPKATNVIGEVIENNFKYFDIVAN